MIPALVFSRNRAAQLDLLLCSAARYAPWVKPTVLYTYDPAHDASYWTLSDEHPGMAFESEFDLERQTRAFIAKHERFLLLVDDAVFFRDAPPPRRFPWALRTTGSYRWARHPPQSEKGWALVVGGTAYRRDMIEPLLDFPFADPNQLERGLHERRDRFVPERIYGGPQSLCTIEHNTVSASAWNPTLGGDVDELRDRYMAGGRLALDQGLAGTGTAHVQVPLRWAEA